MQRGLLEWDCDGARQACDTLHLTNELGTHTWGSSVWVSRCLLWDTHSFHLSEPEGLLGCPADFKSGISRRSG